MPLDLLPIILFAMCQAPYIFRLKIHGLTHKLLFRLFVTILSLKSLAKARQSRTIRRTIDLGAILYTSRTSSRLPAAHHVNVKPKCGGSACYRVNWSCAALIDRLNAALGWLYV